MQRTYGHLTRSLLAGAAGLALTLAPTRAQAGPKLGAELDFALPVSTPSTTAGGGGSARVGYDLSLGVVHLMPEVGAGFHKFGGAASTSVFRGFAGARAGFGAVVRFDGFAHVGYGSLAASGGAVGTPMLDLGLTIDFTLLPVLDLGIHSSYNTALGDAAKLQWLGLGAHVVVAF